jgi:hypothetical protein
MVPHTLKASGVLPLTGGKVNVAMMFEADAMPFPFLAEVPKTTSPKVQRIQSAAKAIMSVIERDGAIIPRDMVAGLVGVSRQRVHQMIEKGAFVQVEIEGHPFITEASLTSWLKEERKGGRPRKVQAPTFAESQQIAREMMGIKTSSE